MKRTQLKDALRNIWANKVSFVSVIVISMLAAVAYLGISYSAAALSRKASSYYREQRMWDVEIASTLLLDEADLDAIGAVSGVERAEPVWQVAAKLSKGASKEPIVLISNERELSRPERIFGRAPKTETECMVEEWLAGKLDIKNGDSITIENDNMAGIDPVKYKTYKVTGVFRHPDHISFQVQTTPYVMVQEESFDLEALDGAFMRARVSVKNAPQNRYSQEYLDVVGSVVDALGQIAPSRAAARADTLRNTYQAKIDEGQKQLDDAAAQLDQARRTLEEGRAQIAEAAEKLGIGKDKLDDGLSEIKSGEEDLQDGQSELRAGKAKLDLVQGYLNKGKDWILNHVTEQDWPPDAGMTYAEFCNLLDTGEENIMAMLYDKSGYNSGLRKWLYAEAIVNAAWRDWYYAGEEYLDGVTQYKAGLRKVEQGEAELAKHQAEYDDGLARLQKAKDALGQIGEGRWIVLNNEGNGGYVFARTSADNLSSLSATFSLIFLVVAGLVIYATVARMVEEQSKLVGATKAMGLYNREIFAKYLLFGVSGTMLGVLIGVLLAHWGIQSALLKAYGSYFTYGEASRQFLPQKTLIVAVGALALSVFSVWLACSRLLRAPAIQLMQGSSLVSKLTKAKRSAKGSLYARLIFLNMRTDLKRVIVTTVSIAGCCILLMIGFTLKFAIGRVNDRQYKEIQHYDRRLVFEKTDDDPRGEALEKVLREQGVEYERAFVEQRSFSALNQLNACTLVVMPADRIGAYYTLRDAHTGELLALPDSGALVPLRMQEVFGIDPGESFCLNDAQMMPCEAKAAGVFENYFGLMAVCSPKAYEEINGSPAEDNCFLIRLNGVDPGTLEGELRYVRGFSALEDAQAESARFMKLTAVLNYLIIAMVVMAGMLAYFILLNLSNTYIQQKSRELTIMRINGFSTGEATRYAAWDLAITTLLGIVLGLAAGAGLGYYVTRLMEQPYFMYVRDADLRSFVFSLLITALLSVGINAIALRKIKRLKLSDLS